MRGAIPNGQQNIAAVHDLFIPILKRLQDQFLRKILPVRKDLMIPDPRRCRGLERDRIDPSGAAGNDFSDFPAEQTVFAAKRAKILIPHHKVRHEIKLSDRPAAGNSEFHKRGAPITPTYGTAKHQSEYAKGAPAQNNQCALSTTSSDIRKKTFL